MDNNIVNNIDIIIFDFDGTLIHRKPHIVQYIQRFFEQRGYSFTSEQVKRAGRWYHEFWKDQSVFDRDPDRNNIIDPNEFWPAYLQEYIKILGCPDSTLKSIISEIVSSIEKDGAETYLSAQTEKVLIHLNEKGYRLGILSNRYNPITDYVNQYGWGSYFDHTYTAGDLGFAKPDREVFIRYLEYFKAKPEVCLYVGDNYWLDYLGAKGAGLTPLLLDVYGWYGDFHVESISKLSELMSIL